MTENIFKIVGYLRRSRQDIQREMKTGEDTLATQRKIITKVLDDLGIPYDIEEEIGSGDKIETRPVFQQVMKSLRNGLYNAIAVKEIARLGRGSYSDMGEIFDLIKEKRIYIITPYKIYDIENPADARQIRFELFFAREEFEMIRERLYGSKLAQAMEGRFMASIPPFGYKVNPVTTKLEIVEEQADIVRMIFDWYVFGIEQPDGSLKKVSFRAIASHLTKLGIPTPRKSSGGWRYNVVRNIITNPAYAGTIVYRKRLRINNKHYIRPESDWIVVENAHEPIVSKDIWEMAQEKVKNNYIPPVKMDFSPCELAGLVVCKKCGNKMVRQLSIQKYKKQNGDISIYRKEFLWCTKAKCTCVKYRDVEEGILTALSQMKLLDVDTLKDMYNDLFIQKQHQPKVDVNSLITKKKKEIERKLQFTFEKFEEGVYTKEDFLRRRAELQAELDNLNKLYQEQSIDENEDEKIILDFKEKVNNILDIYLSCDNKTTKNELLHSIIDEVILEKTEDKKIHLEIIPKFNIDSVIKL